MATQGKAKNKKSTKGVPLDVFLAEEKAAPQGFNVVSTIVNWADAMAEEEIDDTYTLKVNREPNLSGKVLLPTAPKATRGPDFDLAKVPSYPPFKAYLGNLPYDISEPEIHKFFDRLKIKEIRLVHDGGRPKGFGYAEFHDRESLIEALSRNGDTFRNRSLKIGLPGEDHSREPREDRQREDRTASDWRSQAREPPPPPRDVQFQRNGAYPDFPDRNVQKDRRANFDGVDGQYYGNRSRGYDDRMYDKASDRRPADRNRGFGRNRDMDDMQFERNDRFVRSDVREERFYGGPKRFENERRGGFSDRRDDRIGGYNDRRRGEFNSFERRDNAMERRESPPPLQPPREMPKERPKLNLKPRSTPREENVDAPATNSAIFGGAKPVNTAAKELEIEARLLKEKEEGEKKSRDSGSNERIRRISSGSNVSNTTRSRKGSDSGPQRDESDDPSSNRNNTVPRGSYNRQRKHSDRSSGSERTTDSGPKQILRRGPQQQVQQQQQPPALQPPKNVQVAQQPQQPPMSVQQMQPRSRNVRGNGRRAGNGSKPEQSRPKIDKNDKVIERRIDNPKPRIYQNKSDDEEEKKLKDKTAYASANKFAHLLVEDNDGASSE